MNLDNINKQLTAVVHGGTVPKGSIRVSGAKNAATKILAAALISDEKVVLNNFPTELVDAQYKIDFINQSGGNTKVNHESEQIEILSTSLGSVILDNYNYHFRTTYLLVPGLLKRTGIARIPYPGGCKIGSRGFDLHVMVWEKMGCVVTQKNDYIEVKAPNGLEATEINFPISTIGGTESALICAATISQTTIIRNAYISPEVENLIDFLRTMGVSIKVAGNSFVEVTGRVKLSGSVFSIMPDRIEAVTWMVLAAISGGELIIENVPKSDMRIPLIHFKDAGVDYYESSSSIYINKSCLQNGMVQPFELACGTHPGVISDMQAFYVLLGLHANGKSRVYDYRYPERIQYVEQLSKFYKGGLQWEKGIITINGNKGSSPAIVQSTDLRGSMALLMAGLITSGTSEIRNVEMALRGYNKLIDKLTSIGYKITVTEG